MKRYLVLGVAGVLIGALLLSGCGAAQAPSAAAQEQEPSGIAVVGDGKAIGTPDVAYITLGVETTGDTAKAAMDENSRRMNEVVQKIKSLGVGDREIQTSGISLYPVYEQKRVEEPGILPNIIGYRASNTVTVTVNDLQRAPEVLDGVVSVGANSVSGLRFGVKDDSKLRQQALADAAKDAQAEAKAIADALGVRLAGIASVREEVSSGPMPLGDVRAAMGAAESVPVMPGEMAVTARVQVTYHFQ